MVRARLIGWRSIRPLSTPQSRPRGVVEGAARVRRQSLGCRVAEGRSTAERAASARLLDQLNSAASSRLPQPATAAESCASCGRAERAALGSSAETARLPPERLLLVHPDSEISDRSGCSSQRRRTSMLEDLLSALGETLIVAGELHSRSESRAGRSVPGRL